LLYFLEMINCIECRIKNQMKIGGLQKLTLIDYPGQIACTVFTAGCNFRCPFCHNPELVLPEKIKIDKKKEKLGEKNFFDFLEERQGKLDGVCITGGEPTIQPDIIEFIKKIKKMDFLVKLDTNGTNPLILEKVYQEKLVDFVAMDIKNSLENYQRACGVGLNKDKIKRSVSLIRSSRVPYEFRTTVVPTIHTLDDFIAIGKWLRGAKKYALQHYRDEGKILDPDLRKKAKDGIIDLDEIVLKIKDCFEEIEVRS